MATYKVPQDVEAEDKLIAFLSLKQFIFALIFFGTGYLTFLLMKASPFFILMTLPVLIITGVLAFWQRKDQPIEAYLSAVFRFYTKPHKRIWNQDGTMDMVEVTVPPKVDKHYSDERSLGQVRSQLGNLSKLMDTRGWAAKNTSGQAVQQQDTSDRLVPLVRKQDYTPLTEQVSVTASEDPLSGLNPTSQAIAQQIQQQQVSQQDYTQSIVQQAREEATQQQATPQPAQITDVNPVIEDSSTKVQEHKIISDTPVTSAPVSDTIPLAESDTVQADLGSQSLESDDGSFEDGQAISLH